MKDSKNELETEIAALLNDGVDFLNENQIHGDNNWTLKFKELLAAFGERIGNKVCTSGFQDIYNSEWLYDMVWYKEIEKGGIQYISEVVLVIESEWNPDFRSIKYDFEKLLVANASHKLFLCTAKDQKCDELKKYFIEAVLSYRHSRHDDRYLIAILDYYDNTFSYELIIKNQITS